MYIVGFY